MSRRRLAKFTYHTWGIHIHVSRITKNRCSYVQYYHTQMYKFSRPRYSYIIVHSQHLQAHMLPFKWRFKSEIGYIWQAENQSCANKSSLSPRRLAAFNDEAMETWVDKFPLTVKLEEADLRRLVDVVLRKSPFWIPPITFFGIIPRAKHMTSARLLEVLVADLPDNLRTRMLAAPASISESTASRNSPDMVATSSLTWRTRLGTADASLSTSSWRAARLWFGTLIAVAALERVCGPDRSSAPCKATASFFRCATLVGVWPFGDWGRVRSAWAAKLLNWVHAEVLLTAMATEKWKTSQLFLQHPSLANDQKVLGKCYKNQQLAIFVTKAEATESTE